MVTHRQSTKRAAAPLHFASLLPTHTTDLAGVPACNPHLKGTDTDHLTCKLTVSKPRFFSPLRQAMRLFIGYMQWLVVCLLCVNGPVLAHPAYPLCTHWHMTGGECQRVQHYLQALSQQQHFTVPVLRDWLQHAIRQPRILTTLQRPYEHKPWWQYRAHFDSPKRIQGGVAFWQAQHRALTDCEHTFHLPPPIVIAILGVESFYGHITLPYRAIDALTTIAFSDYSRAHYFQKELTQLLLLAREQGRPVWQYRSSYAGAIGMPQFMPSNYRRYAITRQAPNGHLDLAHSAPTAIGSIGYYLAHFGWQAHGPIALALPPPP